jgi:hypothetical protein
MEYLFNTKKAKSRFHLWINGDTACRMYSTGGLQPTQETWLITETPPSNKQVCQMCQGNHAKELLKASAKPWSINELP